MIFLLFPEGLFRNYQASLLEVVRRQEEAVEQVQDALVEAYNFATGQAFDAPAAQDPELQRRLRDIEDRLGDVADSAAWGSIAEESVRPIINRVSVQFENEIERIAGVTPFRQSNQLENFARGVIADQVDLIKTLPKRHFEDIEDLVFKAVDEGWSTDRLAGSIPRSGSNARFNATRIARDQTGRVTGELTKKRHNQAGLKRGVWDTIGDTRVRPDHERLNGRTFIWEEGAGPAGIIPGEEIMCRCVAQVDFTEATSNFATSQPSEEVV